MSNIVIVAGGWSGGWALAPIARELRSQGHVVFTPTLTGLGERRHLRGAGVNLETHIEDITNVLHFEDLTDVVLCGYSYAGMVISGVADRLPERVAALVYIDAFVPQDGDSWWTLAGDAYRQLAIANSSVDGLGVAPPAHLEHRCVAHPLASFLQAIRLSGRWNAVHEKVFIYASGWEGTPFSATYRTLRDDPTWVVKELPCGHNVMAQMPQEFLAIVAGLKVVTAHSR